MLNGLSNGFDVILVVRIRRFYQLILLHIPNMESQSIGDDEPEALE
jgi:hypothetical protein